MITKFFFYNKLKSNNYLSQICPYYKKRPAQVFLKNEILEGYYVEFPLRKQECLNAIQNLGLGMENRQYYCKEVSVLINNTNIKEEALMIQCFTNL